MAKKRQTAEKVVASPDEAELELLRAVRQQPDEEGPFVALAGWLEANADPGTAYGVLAGYAALNNLPTPPAKRGKMKTDATACKRRRACSNRCCRKATS